MKNHCKTKASPPETFVAGRACAAEVMRGGKATKSLPDHFTPHRIARLREMQGLPFDVPANHTVYRQSDFEQSKLWRFVMFVAFVVGIVNLVEPAPTTHAQPAPSAAAHSPHHPTV